MIRYICLILLLFFTGCVVIIEPEAHAHTHFEVQSESWSALANKTLNLVSKKKYGEALSVLQQLQKEFETSDLAEKNLTVQAIHQLTETMLHLEEDLGRVKPNEKKISEAATKLFLAFDAASHSKQPQWKSYYDSLIKKVEKVEGASKKRKPFKKELSSLIHEYELLKPALLVAKSPSTVNHVDSIITFMQSANPEDIHSSLVELKDLLQKVFFGSEKDVLSMFHPLHHLPIIIPFFWIMGFIVAILGIVSWRKHNSFTQR